MLGAAGGGAWYRGGCAVTVWVHGVGALEQHCDPTAACWVPARSGSSPSTLTPLSLG